MKPKFLFALALSLAVTAGLANTSFAHEGREVAGTTIEIGFETEPPIEGIPNGIVVVFTKEAEDHDSMEGMLMDSGTSEIDVNAHGGIFGSGTLEPGATFEYVATGELNNLTIPFHNHLNHDATGELHVMDSAPAADTVTVDVHADHFNPAMVMVQPDTAIVFSNADDSVQTVVSGIAPAEASEVPVLGLERTLRMEITHDESGTTRELALEPVFGQDGSYKATLIPTATGQYSVRLFGSIEGVDVDETFVSGPGTFDDVVPATSVQFPNEIPSGRELEGVARGAQEAVAEAVTAADDADSSATMALTVGIIGVVIGALGLAAGGYALLVYRRPS